MMKWDGYTGRFNGAAPEMTGPSYGHLIHGAHEVVGNDMTSEIIDTARDCGIDHLSERGLLNKRTIKIATDTKTNTLSLLYGFRTLDFGRVLFPIAQFSGPLSLIASKQDGIRQAWICAEVEKLITIGERVLAQKFSL